MKNLYTLLVVVASLSIGCGDDGASSSASGGSGTGGSGASSSGGQGTGGSGTGGSSTGGSGTGGSSTGGNGTGGEFSANEEILATYCELAAAQAEPCGEPAVDLEECRASDEAVCVARILNPDLSEDYFSCFEKTCGNAVCLYVASSPEADAYSNDCFLVHKKCQNFHDDLCDLKMVRTDMIAEFSDCLDLPCESVDDCMESLVPPEC